MTANQVAEWFLSKESMTHKKLQKLCYYAQAWHCALLGKPLFDEEIQAWVHGPVIPALYPKYADYKWQDIPKRAVVPAMPIKTLEVLKAVYNTYGGFSGDQLERLTHSEEPWIQARGGRKPWETCTQVISMRSMTEYYGQKYEASQND